MGAQGVAAESEQLADAILAASRLLVELSARSLASLAPELNLTELRVLSLLCQEGPRRLIDIAAALDVTSTTVTRLADKLTERRLVERIRLSRDRREVHLDVAAAGRNLVLAVSAHRRRALASALRDFSEGEQAIAFRVVHRLADVAEITEAASA